MKTQCHYHCLPFLNLSLDELYQIMNLRQRVFVLEQSCPYVDADGLDPKAWHLMGRDAEGRLLSYARLLGPGVAYEGFASFGRIVTAKEARGTGEGRRLMQHVLSELEQLFPGSPIKISAQSYLEKFYGDFGFTAQGASYLEDNIPHIAMLRRS